MSNIQNPTDKSQHGTNNYEGYPEHPAKEDILRQKNVKQVDVDMDNFSRAKKDNVDNVSEPRIEEPVEYVSDDETDVTPEEKIILESTGEGLPTIDEESLAEATLDSTDEDGELLNEYAADRDLDVPGSDLDDKDEDVGEEDEENNYYSLGGDRHEDLEETKE